MPSIVLPLQSAVYFLEATLSSCGMTLEDEAVQTREALRKRYRQLMKAAGRISLAAAFSSSSAPLRLLLVRAGTRGRGPSRRLGGWEACVSEAWCTRSSASDARGIVVMTPTKETRAASWLRGVVPPNLWLPNATAPLLASTLGSPSWTRRCASASPGRGPSSKR